MAWWMLGDTETCTKSLRLFDRHSSVVRFTETSCARQPIVTSWLLARDIMGPRATYGRFSFLRDHIAYGLDNQRKASIEAECFEYTNPRFEMWKKSRLNHHVVQSEALPIILG